MTIKTPMNNMKPEDGKLYGIYRGVVENRDDPDKLGRCQIRVLGVHSELKDKNESQGIPTDELPWAEAAMGITEGSVSGFGLWSVPLQGSHVFVFFENNNMMQPRYFASAPGLPVNPPNKSKGFNDPDGNYPSSHRLKESDVHRLARGISEETIIQYRNDNKLTGMKTAQGTWDEPDSAYNAKYPDNIVLATHSGITIEIDSTEGEERLHVYHPSNSCIEINKSGDMIIRNSGERFDIVEGTEKKFIGGTYDRTVSGERSSYVESNETEVVNGKRKSLVKGNEDVTMNSDRSKTVGGNENVKIGGQQAKDIGTSQSVTVAGIGTLSYGGALTISASSISIGAGGATVGMDGGALTISASSINLN